MNNIMKIFFKNFNQVSMHIIAQNLPFLLTAAAGDCLILILDLRPALHTGDHSVLLDHFKKRGLASGTLL